MEPRVVFWTLALCTIVSYWFYANSKLEIDYERHAELVDPISGAIHQPRELLDLAKIIQPSPQYINSTNAIERLYDLAYLSSLENPFVLDQSYSRKEDLLLSGWPVANRTQCTKQLGWILEQLGQHRNYSSLRGQLGYDLTNYMDSFGRPETGLFSGSIHWLGSYKRCMSAKLNAGRFKTRYCVARMRFKSWPERENMYPLTRIRVGICLPETCDTASYNGSKTQIDQLTMFDMPEKIRENLVVDSLMCLPDERSPIRRIPTGGRVFLVIVGVWIAIVIMATFVYETLIRHDIRLRAKAAFIGLSLSEKRDNPNIDDEGGYQMRVFEQIICSISIRGSIKALKTNTFRVKYHEGQRVRLNLGALDFVKVSMTLLVVLAHAGYLGNTHMRSMSSRIEVLTGEYGLLAMAVGRCVDTFFLFFGVLTSYNLLKKFSERQLANPLMWIAVNIGILARIAPLFMFVYWYSKLVSPYIGAGPWWDYGFDKTTIKGTCLNEPWWKSIPHLGSSGTPSVPSCNLPSWFIVSYSQISLLMPLITYLIYKLPNRVARCILVIFLLAASAGSIAVRLALQTTIREEGATIYGAFLLDLLEKFESTGHLTTLSRLGAVGIGCFVGYLLKRYEENDISSWPKWIKSKIVNWGCIFGLTIMVFLPVIGRWLYLFTGKLATWPQFIGFNVLLIIVWPIFVAIIVISFTTSFNHKVWMRFACHSFWHCFGRLGLCIFMIHWEVLYMVITGFEQAPSHGFVFDIMKFWSFGVFFSILFALIIHILIEAPLANLVMIIYRHSATKRTKSPIAVPKHKDGAQLKQQSPDPSIASSFMTTVAETATTRS